MVKVSFNSALAQKEAGKKEDEEAEGKEGGGLGQVLIVPADGKVRGRPPTSPPQLRSVAGVASHEACGAFRGLLRGSFAEDGKRRRPSEEPTCLPACLPAAPASKMADAARRLLPLSLSLCCCFFLLLLGGFILARPPSGCWLQLGSLSLSLFVSPSSSAVAHAK